MKTIYSIKNLKYLSLAVLLAHYHGALSARFPKVIPALQTVQKNEPSFELFRQAFNFYNAEVLDMQMVAKPERVLRSGGESLTIPATLDLEFNVDTPGGRNLSKKKALSEAHANPDPRFGTLTAQEIETLHNFRDYHFKFALNSAKKIEQVELLQLLPTLPTATSATKNGIHFVNLRRSYNGRTMNVSFLDSNFKITAESSFRALHADHRILMAWITPSVTIPGQGLFGFLRTFELDGKTGKVVSVTRYIEHSSEQKLVFSTHFSPRVSPITKAELELIHQEFFIY
jgi:hypothetical protein